MKQRTKKFRVGSTTYFHHQHGVYVAKKRGKSMAATMSVLIVMTGGFFVGKEFAWPLISNNSGVQRVQQAAENKLIPSEKQPDNKNAEPIRTEDELLGSIIEDKLATMPAGQKWSVFVYDLKTERTASVNIEEKYASASLYKLFLVEALEQKLPYDQWQWTWVGNSSVADCVETMLKSEDNPCAQELGDFIGWDKIEELNKKSGYNGTTVAGDNGRETNAKDLGEFFARLKKGQILSDNARRFVFDALYQQSPSKGIAKGCKQCRTANKLGELKDVAHDAGIVTRGSRDYVLVVLSEGGSYKQIADLTKIIEQRFVR